MAREEEDIDLTDLNHTELVLLAHWAGLPASRAIPRDDIIFSLENLVGIVYLDPLDEKRGKLSAWLRRYWKKFQLQAAKKVCPNCTHCRDAQLLECYELNKSSFGG